jgi:septal ring factor EnvC (AmiA/AmiB activator)
VQVGESRHVWGQGCILTARAARVASVMLGGALLIAGASAIALADQQRVDAVEQARAQVERAEERLASAREDERELADQLATLNETIAEQDEELADTEGFLR